MRRALFAVCLLSLGSLAQAQVPPGTWIKRGDPPSLAMIVEPAGAGIKVTYKAVGPDRKPVDPPLMTVETQFDGKDAPVMANGEPSGQTMAVTRVDASHTSTVVKFQGKLHGTSKSELSADGKTLKVESDTGENAIGPQAGKQIEYWDKQ